MTKQIVVVDDEAGVRMLLSVMLARDGFTVLEVEDALTALDLLNSIVPDLCILDVMMPGMDGIELCRRIRARPQTAETPVIMLSARGDVETIQQALEAGANDYLSKPVFHHDLLAKVRMWLCCPEKGPLLAKDHEVP